MLSPVDQTKLDQAKKELQLLKKRQNVAITQTSNDYFQQLKELHEKHDRLNDKLN
jgi:hypothetical protein